MKNQRKLHIPKIIHQIWLGPKPRPVEWMDSWKLKNPDWEYKLWTEENIPKLYNQAQFDKITLYPGKADILRYELLYKYGGVYIDADCDCLNPLDDYLRQFHFFVGYENEYFFPGLIATTIMGSEPEHPLLAQLINKVSKIEDVNSDHSWITVGPKFLTANIRQYEALNSPIKKLPCYKFYPIHWSGWNYKGKGKVYSTHHWISTTNIQKFEYDSSKKGPTHDGNS